MKGVVARFAIVSFVCWMAVWPAIAQQTGVPLTNAAIVKLVRAGFKEKTVVAIIHTRPNQFNLNPDRLIELKRSGVSETIILAMLAENESLVLADDEWMDNSGFRGAGSAGVGNEKERGGSDIFGSSSGSRSQSSGRGMNGEHNGETATTGSATVRILHPPAEAGAPSLKMEKTPALTNDSVIKLVEAGFSEGTIIKRIEDSPVEFDLSSPKLEELRRRRVTEAIILAMTAAMGDVPGSTTTKVN